MLALAFCLCCAAFHHPGLVFGETQQDDDENPPTPPKHTNPHPSPPTRPSVHPPAHTAEAVCTTTVPAEINPLFEVELNSRATCNEGCWRRRRLHTQSQPRCRNIWLLIYARKEPPPHRRVRRRWRDRSHCTDATLERTTRQKKTPCWSKRLEAGGDGGGEKRCRPAPHHATLGLGEPKVSHSSEAFWPSTKVYTLPSSLRIWAGSSENKHTQREVSQPHRNRRH